MADGDKQRGKTEIHAEVKAERTRRTSDDDEERKQGGAARRGRRSARPRVVIETPAPLGARPVGAPLGFGRPIVIERKSRKKRYSRGTRDYQRFERDTTRAFRRVSDATASAWQTYDEESERSARRKRDGAVRDVWQNSALAAGDFLSESSRAPYDLVRNLDGDWFWRQGRQVIRGFLPIGWTR